MISPTKTITLGVVSYCADIIPIWEGMRHAFRKSNVDIDFITFTSYDRQVEALLNKTIDIAWNGPLAHVRLQKRTSITSLGMRDVDKGFKTYLISQKQNLKNFTSLKCLEGKAVVAGSYDSPQAYVMPIHFLQSQSVNLKTIDLTRYDKDIGKHGDTAIGEMDVIQALRQNKAEYGFVSKLMFDRSVQAGWNDNQGVELSVLPYEIPGFNHCQFDALSTLPLNIQELFKKGLFGMKWSNESDRKIMILEGIKKEWCEPEESGYEEVKKALKFETLAPYPGPLHTLGNHPFKSLNIIN